MRKITGTGHAITRYGRDIPHKHREYKFKRRPTPQERRAAALERRRAAAEREAQQQQAQQQAAPSYFSFPPSDFLTSTDTGTSKYEQYADPSFPWTRTQMKVEFSKYADTKFDIRDLREWYKLNIMNHPGEKHPQKTVNEVSFQRSDWIVMPGYAIMYNKVMTMGHTKYPQELQGMMTLMQGTSAQEVAAWALYVKNFLTGDDPTKGQLANVDSLWSFQLGKAAVIHCSARVHRAVEDAYAQGTKGMTIAAFSQQFLVPLDNEIDLYYALKIGQAYRTILNYAQGKIELPPL
tara:strand:+ start:565 stop:1440 length:876 start_codon:yes stop_codon:yes gene_type:complete